MMATFLLVVIILGFEFLKMFLQWWDSISPGTPQKVWYTLGIIGLVLIVIKALLGIEG